MMRVPMKVHLAYGRHGLDVEPPDDADVLLPERTPALPQPEAAVREALRQPIGSPPLSALLRPSDSIAVVISDITRPVPNQLLLPPILETVASAGIPRRQVVIVNATGTHRANTREELLAMVGPEVLDGYRIVQHDARDRASLALVTTSASGVEVRVNAEYLRADVKILTGFVEPHIFAGYSGGGKAVLPGIAGADIIMSNHGADMLSHPKATWCETVGNPIFEEMRDVALATRPTFLVNVTLNEKKEITGVFAGEMVAAHDAGIAQAGRQALRPIPHLYDIAVTTNMGHPADINFYQAGKGASVALRALREGGTVVLAAECADGLGLEDFVELLTSEASATALLDKLHAPGFAQYEQWGVQCWAMIQRKADVHLYSSMPAETARAAHVIPCSDVSATVQELARRHRAEHGSEPSIAVLPHGHLTVPWLKG
jgi:nickel-dependent lactate racemase